MTIQTHTLTVDQVSSRIQVLISADPVLQVLNVRGEIQEFKRHTSGHAYFTLGGEKDRLAGVMFRSETRNLPNWPKVGDEVIVQGRISIYPARSTYQVYARNIIPIGLGAAARAKEELRKKLEDEGLFDPRLKRPLPDYPSKIAVVTSPTGAAVQDVIKVARKRFPICSIRVIPTIVQGLEAPELLVKALRHAVNVPGVEAVLLARGGGSKDDLNPFDSELVVRAVRSLPIPVITGLGHEIDLTLSDMAADVSASTPSAAAERLLPDGNDTLRFLDNQDQRICSILIQKTDYFRSLMDRYSISLKHSLGNSLIRESGSLSEVNSRMLYLIQKRVHNQKLWLSTLASSLNALSPLSVLSRGFITCQTPGSEKMVTSVEDLEIDSRYSLHFKDGTALAEVKDISFHSEDI